MPRYGGTGFPEEPETSPSAGSRVGTRDTRNEIRNERLDTDAAAVVAAPSRFFPSPVATTSYDFMLGCTHDL